jgi:hypothetical protein
MLDLATGKVDLYLIEDIVIIEARDCRIDGCLVSSDLLLLFVPLRLVPLQVSLRFRQLLLGLLYLLLVSVHARQDGMGLLQIVTLKAD